MTEMIKISFPDGLVKEFKINTTPLEIAESISQGLAKASIAAKINGEISDLKTKIQKNSSIEIITEKSPHSLPILRHTTAHIFAQALLRLHPNAKITIGPPIENGFYYDIDFELSEEEFPKIEEEMQKIIKEDLKIEKEEIDIEEALKFYKENPYKTELIKALSSNTLKEEEEKEGSIEENKLRFYKQGEFMDLCKGPHLPRTGLVKAFKLEKVTRAYWRGNAENKQLYRIYGTAFWKKTEMEEHYQRLEEAKKRDHRILGKQMELFMFHEFSPGSAFFLPNGFIIWKELQNFIRSEYEKRNYKEVMTPNMFNTKLWEISGHLEHYLDDMFSLNAENSEFALKPMNCPSHCLIFKNKFRSYKELPIRIADFGALHRNELSGALSGLTRVRKFCQDDAHIFCTNEQIEEEIDNAIKFVKYVYGDIFKMEYSVELSTRPEGFIGSLEIWEKAEKALEDAINRNNLPFKLNQGDGAFYGPKIDFKIKDSLGRIHQSATIQLDFNLPERFNLNYEGSDNKEHRPVMIHRAILGSLERFMAIMIEHFAGKLPLWLSPIQIKILNVADRHLEYCNEISEKLKQNEFRVSENYEHQTLNNKIRLAQEEKPNYIMILGDRDIENKTISIRDRENKTQTLSFDTFLEKIKEERSKKLIN